MQFGAALQLQDLNFLPPDWIGGELLQMYQALERSLLAFAKEIKDSDAISDEHKEFLVDDVLPFLLAPEYAQLVFTGEDSFKHRDQIKFELLAEQFLDAAGVDYDLWDKVLSAKTDADEDEQNDKDAQDQEEPAAEKQKL